MNRQKGSSLIDTKHMNRVLIRREIFRRKQAYRTEIAKTLGLTLPTITTTVQELIREGLAEEVFPEKTDAGSAGRPASTIRFRADAGCFLGIELGPYETLAAVIDLKGRPIRTKRIERASEDYGRMTEELDRFFRELTGDSEADEKAGNLPPLMGAGIGLPGFIDRKAGVIRSNPREQWTGKALAEDMAGRWHLPVLIDNNVRLRAAAYALQENSGGRESFAYFFVSRGVACPLVFNDRIVSGDSFGAGELGQMILMIRDETGAMIPKKVDDLASEPALLSACQKRLFSAETSGLGKGPDAERKLSMEQLLDLAGAGNKAVQEAFSETGSYLGMALANVVNLVNPGRVVVDGRMFFDETAREAMLKTAGEAFYGLNEEETEIRFLPADAFRGACAAAVGACECFLIEGGGRTDDQKGKGTDDQA